MRRLTALSLTQPRGPARGHDGTLLANTFESTTKDPTDYALSEGDRRRTRSIKVDAHEGGILEYLCCDVERTVGDA